jgi:uncharacterized protein (DUF58 family)
MKEFRIFFTTLTVILFVMCFAYHSRLMPFLLTTVIVLCVTSLVLGIITRLSLVIEVKEAQSAVRRKEQINLTVQIKNRFLLPMTPVRIYVKVCEKGMYFPQNKMLIVSLAPLGEVTLNIQNVVSFRGMYSLGLERVEFFDILKTCRFKIRRRSPWWVTSYPRELTTNSVRDDNQEESEVSRTKPHGFNKDSFSHLREYREGESLRNIHWKLSARMPDGELIVKQMESNHDYSALVFCDFAMPFDRVEAFLEASDIAIETSLAIIRRVLLSMNSAIFLWQDGRTGESEIKEVVDLHSCSELNNSLALLPVEPYDGEFSELFDEFYEEMRLERAIYIVTAAVTDDLIEKLRSTGLIFQKNVTIVVILPDSALNQRDCIEYLTTQSKITVCRVQSDDDEEIKSFNESGGGL